METYKVEVTGYSLTSNKTMIPEKRTIIFDDIEAFSAEQAREIAIDRCAFKKASTSIQRMEKFYIGQKISVRSNAIHQETQLFLDNKIGEIVEFKQDMIICRINIKGKFYLLPFFKNELINRKTHWA